MKKIQAIIRPAKLEDVKKALAHAWIAGLTVSEVSGYGRQKGRAAIHRGAEYDHEPVPKVAVEIVVPDPLVPRLVQDLIAWIRTGKIGDGKIFVSSVEQAVQVRTGERGEAAL